MVGVAYYDAADVAVGDGSLVVLGGGVSLVVFGVLLCLVEASLFNISLHFNAYQFTPCLFLVLFLAFTLRCHTVTATTRSGSLHHLLRLSWSQHLLTLVEPIQPFLWNTRPAPRSSAYYIFAYFSTR
jgi:hypothetical protein